jgi:hypothetical protein
MARRHHYQFAHLALRGVCAGDPVRFFAIMGSSHQAGLIRDIWSEVCERCDPLENTEILPDEIKVTCARLGVYPIILVEMPEVKAPAEAIYIAIVLLSDKVFEAPPDEVDFRYFTLELGEDLDGDVRTVLCEWSGDSHLNMGDGPAPDLEGFAAEVQKYLKPPFPERS